jgi:hypothetical protein
MHNPLLIKTFTTTSAIGSYLIAAHDVNDRECKLSTAATDALVGITQLVGADAAGDRVDLVLAGAVKVTYGGTVAKGDRLTSDASGRAITTTTAGNKVLGIALKDGVVGDVGSVHISPSVI